MCTCVRGGIETPLLVGRRRSQRRVSFEIREVDLIMRLVVEMDLGTTGIGVTGKIGVSPTKTLKRLGVADLALQVTHLSHIKISATMFFMARRAGQLLIGCRPTSSSHSQHKWRRTSRLALVDALCSGDERLWRQAVCIFRVLTKFRVTFQAQIALAGVSARSKSGVHPVDKISFTDGVTVLATVRRLMVGR